jgi:hypothetical protein
MNIVFIKIAVKKVRHEIEGEMPLKGALRRRFEIIY